MEQKMHPVGFEPTHLSIAELKSAPLDHSGTNALHNSYKEHPLISSTSGRNVVYKIYKVKITTTGFNQNGIHGNFQLG